MDASALVKGVDSRPTLGRVGVGPLGGVHTDMLEEILNNQRSNNPVKRVSDFFADFFLCIFHCLGMLVPTRVSPELAFEKSRPLRPELIFVNIGLLAVSIFGVIFLGSAVISGQVGTKWHGPTTCEVRDFVTEEIGALNKKLVMKVLPGENQQGIRSYFTSEIEKHQKKGYDQPFSCNFNKSKLDLGPCCHSNYGVYEYGIGDKFSCYFTTDVSYCNVNAKAALTADDDYRGLGPNPSQGLSDKLNGLCCEPSVPTNYTGVIFPLILSGGCCLVTLWCLLFRWKKGVWHRMCPTSDYPPVQAHAFDTKLDKAAADLALAEKGKAGITTTEKELETTKTTTTTKKKKQTKAEATTTKKPSTPIKKPSTPPTKSK